MACTPAKLPSTEARFYDPDHYVIKLKFEKWEEFSELIISHLTKLLDLPGEELDILRGISTLKDGSNKLNIKHWPKMKKKENKSNVLGTALSDEAISQVQQLSDYLGENLEMEGLFRKPGNSIRQNQLVTALSTGACIDFSKSKFHPHDVASVLKTFLGQLSEPLLLPSKHFNAHIQISNMMKPDPVTHKPTMIDKGKRIETLQLLLLLLPTNHRNVLRAIMNLLYQTAKHQETNKMNAANLAAMFAPHLLWPRNHKASDLHENAAQLNDHVAFIIRHSQKIFTAPLCIREACKAFFPVNLEYGSNVMSPQVSTTQLVAPSSAVKRSSSARIQYRERAKQQTETAMSDLYEKVTSMPNSAKKKKIVKNFEKHNEVLQYRAKTRKRNRTFSGILRKRGQSTAAKANKESYQHFPQPGDEISEKLPKPDLLNHCNTDSLSLNFDVHEKNHKVLSHTSLPENITRSCKTDVRSPRLTAISKQIRLLQQRGTPITTRSQLKKENSAPVRAKQIKVSTV